MRKRELLREIDLAFEEAGEKGEWLHRSFHNLYELNQLSHFQIFDLNWFNGAAKILELVDQLHTVMTPKEDFLELADALHLEVPTRISKKELAAIVKSKKSWRVRAFDLESQRKRDNRKLAMQPLFDHLASLGYETNSLPKHVDFRRWMVDCTNKRGDKETLYLNENETGDLVFIQSTLNDFLDIYRMDRNLFVHATY